MGICCLGTQRPVPCKRRSSRACRNHVLLNFLLPLGGVDRGVKALGPSDPPHSSTCPPVSLPADLQLMRRGLMPPGPGGSRDSVVASVLAGGSFALTTSKSRRKKIFNRSLLSPSSVRSDRLPRLPPNHCAVVVFGRTLLATAWDLARKSQARTLQEKGTSPGSGAGLAPRLAGWGRWRVRADHPLAPVPR